MRLQHFSSADGRHKRLSPQFFLGTALALGQAPDYRPEAKTCWTTGGEFIYDLLAGRYMGVGMKSGRPANYVTGLERLTPDYYTPANVRRLGR